MNLLLFSWLCHKHCWGVRIEVVGLIIQHHIKGLFQLRAWNGVFFVCFINFFASLSVCLDFKQEKVNNRKRMLHFMLVVETSRSKTAAITPCFLLLIL